MMDRIVLHHLKTRSEIETILPLREGIDLSALSGDSDFIRLEKKETSAASSSDSSWMATP
jgi:hypothetical protein